MTAASPASEREDSSTAQATWLTVGVRYVLPGVVVLGGLIVMAFGSEADLEGGAGIVSAGLAVYAMSWLYRASVDGDRARDQEEAARAYLDLHGHWPDEAPRGVPLRASAASRQAASREAPSLLAPGTRIPPRRRSTSDRPRRGGPSH